MCQCCRANKTGSGALQTEPLNFQALSFYDSPEHGHVLAPAGDDRRAHSEPGVQEEEGPGTQFNTVLKSILKSIAKNVTKSITKVL